MTESILNFARDKMQAVANAVQDVGSCNWLLSPRVTDLDAQRMGPFPVDVKPGYKAREDGSTMKALAWMGTKDVALVDVPGACSALHVSFSIFKASHCSPGYH